MQRFLASCFCALRDCWVTLLPRVVGALGFEVSAPDGGLGVAVAVALGVAVDVAVGTGVAVSSGRVSGSMTCAGSTVEAPTGFPCVGSSSCPVAVDAASRVMPTQ